MTTVKKTAADVRAEEDALIDAELEARMAANRSDELDRDFEEQERAAEQEGKQEAFYEFGKDIFFVGEESTNE